MPIYTISQTLITGVGRSGVGQVAPPHDEVARFCRAASWRQFVSIAVKSKHNLNYARQGAAPDANALGVDNPRPTPRRSNSNTWMY